MRCILLFSFLQLSIFVFSQNKTETVHVDHTSLKELLNKIEDQFDVRFSYQENVINQYDLDFDISNLSFSDVLKKLSEDTVFTFDKISDRYIVIRFDKNKHLITLRGRLVDKLTQTPLPGGSIVNMNQKQGIASDKDGYFRLDKITKSDSISVKFIGFASIKFPAHLIIDSVAIKIEMIESSEELKEVLIDQIGDGQGNNHDGSIVLSSDDFKSFTASSESDLFEGLQLIPGIISPSESSSDLHIRGGSPDQNLVLWNNITIYQNAHFFGMISALNPHQVSNVKVFRSDASAQYGNRVAGVIDMKSDRRFPEKFKGSLGWNFNFVDALVNVPVKKDKVSFNFSLRRSYSDIIRTPTYKNYAERVFQNTIILENKELKIQNSKSRTNFHFKDFALNTNIRFSDKNRLFINYLYSVNDLDYSFFIDTDYKSKDDLKIKNQGLSLISEYHWNSRLKQITKVNYSYYDLNFFSNVDNGDNFKTKKMNRIQEYCFDSEFQILLNSKSKLKTGLQLSIQNVDLHVSFNGEDIIDNGGLVNFGKENSYAFFSEYQYNIKRKFFLNLGLRTVYFLNTKDIFLEPRIYSKIKLTNPLYLKFAASIKSQNMSQVIEFDDFGLGLENQSWVLSNDVDIPILKSKQVSAGLNWSHKSINIDIETYFKQIEGLTSVSKAFVKQSIPYTEGDSKTFGLDAIFRYKNPKSNYLLSYSWLRTKYQFYDLNGGRPFTGNFDIRHSVSAVSTFHWKNFDFSVKWAWRTGKPYTPALGLIQRVNVEGESYYDIKQGEINSQNLSCYHRLDFSSSYKFKLLNSNLDNFKLGFTLLNIYNRKNILDRNFFVFYGTTNSIKEVNRYSLGITPNIFLRFEF